MATRVKEARTYSVSLVVQDVTDFPNGELKSFSAEVSFVTDDIDNIAMNFEQAPVWARQRIAACTPVLLDQLLPEFINHALYQPEEK